MGYVAAAVPQPARPRSSRHHRQILSPLMAYQIADFKDTYSEFAERIKTLEGTMRQRWAPAISFLTSTSGLHAKIEGWGENFLEIP